MLTTAKTVVISWIRMRLMEPPSPDGSTKQHRSMWAVVAKPFGSQSGAATDGPEAVRRTVIRPLQPFWLRRVVRSGVRRGQLKAVASQ